MNRKKKTKTIDNLYPKYFTYPAVILFLIFYAVPVIAAFIMSFTDWNIMRLFEPKFIGIKNFLYLMKDDYFSIALKNTVKFGLVTTIFIVVIGLVLALALNSKIFGKSLFRTLFYLPSVLSLIVIGIIFTAVFKMDGGVLNNLLNSIGLGFLTKDWLGTGDTALNSIIFVQIWGWSGYAMTIYLAGISGISKDYYEAATIDGANKFQQLKNITLPLLAPAFTIVVTINVIGGFKVFEQVYVMTGGGPGFSTQVLSTYVYREFSKGNLGRSTAMGLVLFILISIISLTINKILKKREVDM